VSSLVPRRLAAATLAGLLAIACARPEPDATATASNDPAEHRLPTGVLLDPAGRSVPVGNMPLAVVASPDGRDLVVSLSGWREQGLAIVRRETGAVVQRLSQPGAFLGLAWSADGTRLYAAGGMSECVYVYAWTPAAATPARLVDSIAFGVPDVANATPGSRYPAGLALSADGRRLYVAENLDDSLAVVDLATRRVVQRLGTGEYPYAVVAARDGRVYVSDWGGSTVHVYRAAVDGRLAGERSIDVGRHPSALALSADGARLFAASAGSDRVAAVDTRARRVLRWLADPPPGGVDQGSTPDALALSADGTRLYVAEADANAVAVFDLSALVSGVAAANGADTLAGRIPTDWYPTALLAGSSLGDSVLVVNGKGRGTGPNRSGPRPGQRLEDGDPRGYTLGQLDGTITVVPGARGTELAALSARVRRANGWDAARGTLASAAQAYPPIEHVVYVIKENRTYDQLLGDLTQADGDTSLLFFPRAVSPNHHALAERFGIYDRFFVNAEVSEQGHPWSTAGYVTDYLEKTTPDSYRLKRNEPGELGDVDDPASGHLWDAAARAKLWMRNYGENTEPLPRARDAGDVATDRPDDVRALLPTLQPVTSPAYPSFDMAIPDQRRADAWLAELRGYEREGRMPALEIVQLPGDHTAGARKGMCTPRACVADNDLALGRIVEALSRSRFWRGTALFVLEDDAQSGADHVDSHRSVLLTISPWARGAVRHRFVNTTDVLATIEEILHLPPFSSFDRFGRPLREIWRDTPDLRPYVALTPAQPIAELNVATGSDARRSATFDLAHADRIDDALFNQLLWRTVKGATVPYPLPRRASSQEYARAR
jgi:YVTN family beta-propeller protein